MQRKGQLTIFIIVGIVLLFATALVMYLYQDRSVSIVPKVEVPSDVIPVHDYVTQCVNIVGKNALFRVGLQGGILDPPNKIVVERSYVPLGGIIINPYWYYRGENRIPTVSYIETQLEQYMEDNLEECTNSFGSLDEEFLIQNRSGVKANVQVLDGSVLWDVNYTLLVKKRDSSTMYTLDRYVYNHDIRLKEMIELATDTIHSENQKHFLENTTIDFMALHPDIPFTDLRFYCGTLSWRVSDVRDTLQNILYYNLPRARFDGTDYLPFEASKSVYEDLRVFSIKDLVEGDVPNRQAPEDAYDYFHLFYNVTDLEYPNLKMKVMYLPDYGMRLNARPSAGGIMKSNMMPGMPKYLSYICINLYHFTYDVEYPVVFTIEDPDGFDGEGYSFKFSTPVIIDHNRGMRADSAKSIYEDVMDELPDLCNDREKFDIYMTAKGIRQGYINQPLPGVNLSYDCIKFNCDLGVTSNVDGEYRIRTKLPSACSYGFVKAEKPGYMTTVKQYDGSTHFTIDMAKLKNFSVKIVKHRDGKPGSNLELINDEGVLLNLYNKNYDYAVYAAYVKGMNATLPLIVDNTNYTLDLLLMDMKQGTLLGGYRAEWSTKLSDLLDADTVTFHVIYPLERPEPYELVNEIYVNDSYDSALAPTLTLNSNT